MRVLLLSPLRDLDPACGDIVHTESLLNDPPDGVEYENYAEAIARGALVEHATRASLRRAWATGEGRWLETWMTGLAKVVNLLRRARLLFWEPFRILSVRPGEYDLVHVHAFNCGFREIDCPVVMGCDLPTRYLYTDARGYSQMRVKFVELIERGFAAILGVNLTSYRLPQIRRVIVPSEDTADWFRQHALVPKNAVDVIPTYLESVPALPANPKPFRVGFIARDFDAKGGPLLLEAFALLRKKLPGAELIIVGSTPRPSAEEQLGQGIHWLPFVSREGLLENVLPLIDVLAYPTRFDGFPLVLLEAMSRGLAIAATSYRAIPEMLDHGRAGLLSPVDDAEALAANLQTLLDPATNRCFRAAALDHFEASYSARAVRKTLAASYHRATDDVSPEHRADPVPQQRLDYIDGLRGLAAAVVLLYHAWIFSGSPWNSAWNPLESGYAGVNLFLVLSGFCIYWPLANGRSMSLREFAVRRFRRIAPPYYAAIALFGVIALVCGHFAWTWPESPQALVPMAKMTASHVLFLHNLLPNHILTIAGPFWSIGLEMQLYLAMPILAAIAARWGIRRAVLVAAAVTLAYRTLASLYFGGAAALAAEGMTTAFVVNSSLPGRWLEFALGMWAAVLVAQSRVSPQSSLPLGLGAGALLVAAIATSTVLGKYHVLTDPLFGAAFFLGLLAVATGAHRPESRFARILCWKPLVGLGLFSYSLYLLHSPIVHWMAEMGRPWIASPAGLFFLVLAVGAPFTVGLAALFYHLFEKPFIGGSKPKPAPRPVLSPLDPVSVS
jgi:peptidoglycan/LPS O-acetylase OafA/YrhL/glycosyltransferase involved in cell wall biosynthesis